MVVVRSLIWVACDLDKSYHKAKRHGLIMTQEADVMLMEWTCDFLRGCKRAIFKEETRCHWILHGVHLHKSNMDISCFIQMSKTHMMKMGLLIEY